MKRTLLIGLMTMLPALGACADTADDDIALEQPAAEQTTLPEAAPAPMQPEGGMMLQVSSAAAMGPYLTDGSGRALYLLEGEPQGESSCYDACAEEWPPLLAPQGAPSTGAGDVEASRIGTIQRRDGSAQVTYGGHALYYYHDDTGAGQTQGQDLTDQWGEWYLVQPNGQPLEEHEGES